MELQLINQNGEAAGQMEGADALFARAYNEDLVHQLVVSFMSNARAASSKQKDRSEIKATTKKPFAQKGTGRARAGMSSSPLWRSGGQIFPNTGLENYRKKINKKMYRAGLASIFSQLVNDNRLKVVEELKVDAPKTKLFADQIKQLGLSNERVLVVTSEVDENLYLAARNLPNVIVVEPHQADPVSLVGSSTVVLTRSAVSKLEELFA